MAISIAEFWKLAVDSRLLAAPACEQLSQSFSGVKGAAAQANAVTLAEWLITQNLLSRYQAAVLLAGKAGPFVFGDYRAFDRIESGRPLAGAYRAVHVPTGHVVMLEFARSEVAGDADRFAVALRASRALANANLPRLRRTYELAEADGYKFLVAEAMEGATLAEVVTRSGRIAPPEACRLAWQVAQGLSQLHSLGLVHGRLTPDSILVDAVGDAKLVYRPLEVSGPINFGAPDATKNVLPLADWLAPELAQPGRPPDLLTDIYALGCVFYGMVAGQPPFAGGDVAQKLARHAGQPIHPLEPYGVPPPIAQLIAYLMAKNTGTRVSSAAAVVDALARWIPASSQSRPTQAPPPTLAAYESWLAERPARGATAGLSSSASAEAPCGRRTQQSPIDSPAAIATVATTPRPTAYSATRSSSTTWIGIAAAALVLLVGGGIFLATTGNPTTYADREEAKPKRPKKSQAVEQPVPAKTPVAPATNPKTTPVAAAPKTDEKPVAQPPPAVREPREEAIDDDGQSLWVSPTSGPPVTAQYVGLGAQAMIALRPAAMLADAEGTRVLTAFGPAGEAWRQEIETTTGVKLEQMENLVVALYATSETMLPRASYVVRLSAPADEKELAKNWKDAGVGKYKDEKIYASESTAYYLPAKDAGRTLVVGSPDAAREIIDHEGRPAQLGPQLDALLSASDAERHVTLLVAPQFAFGGSRQIFSGAAQALRDPLEAFIGDDVRATLVSCHVDDAGFFLEARALVNVERKPDELAKQYFDRLSSLADQVENAQLGRAFSRYAEKIVRRYPNMLREAIRFTRHGRENDQAVLRCWLPPAAAHNLVLATELALREYRGSPAAVAAKTPPQAPTATSAAEKLKKSISLSFPRDTLEKAVEYWANETGVKVAILGSDLQLDGVTKNQQFELAEREQSADAVLRAILLKASPQGKLVYVIKRDPPDAEETVFITTRSAAEKRKDPIPPGFEPPNKKPEMKTAQKTS
jgi:serine/threonine protein kinase